MQQLDFVDVGRLEWREATAPRLEGPKEALVRPFAVATCDLDRSLIRGLVAINGPFAFGHEGVAEVIDVGDEVSAVRPGDLVSVPFQVSCGECAPCRLGRTAHCVGLDQMPMYGLGPLGGGNWGGFLSDVVRVPFADHMLLPVPDGVDPVAIASLSDNIADGWRLVAPQLGADPGAAVLIVGGGSVSLYAAAIALALGASTVDCVGGKTQQQEIASRLGARIIEGPIPKRLGPYPITVDASADRACLHCALCSTGPDGFCTSAGIYFGEDTPVPLAEMYTKGIRFQTGRVHARTVMPQALQLVVERRIHPELVTTETAAWDQAPDALAGYETKLVISRPRLAQ